MRGRFSCSETSLEGRASWGSSPSLRLQGYSSLNKSNTVIDGNTREYSAPDPWFAVL